MAKAPKQAAKRTRIAPSPDDDAGAVFLPTMTDEAPGPENFIPVDFLIRYEAFVTDYLQSFDASGAAKRAGFEAQTEPGQRALGSRMLGLPYIRTRLHDQARSILAKLKVTPERIYEELSHIAFCDMAGAYDADGNPLPIPKIPEHVRRAITGYKEVEKTFGEDGHSLEKELKFSGKDAALEKMMRLLRMVDQDRLVLVTGEEMEKAMREGRERARAKR